jgi:DNA recombination protein RmuC
MEIWLIGLAILFAGLAIAVAIASGAGRTQAHNEQAARIGDQIVGVRDAHTALTERLQALAEAHATSQAMLTKLLEERLDKVSQRMGQSLTDTATKTAESLGKLNNRLNVIDQAQKNITELSGQVVGLQDILANKQARGAFGELQLTELVKAALPPSAFQFQVTLGNNKRADCLINLPNPPGPIVIDAKFPLESFYALRAADDNAAKAQAQRDFRTAIQKHVSDIADKYIVPGETAESALMFLPSEAIYAELYTNFTDLVQKSYSARVWIVSPTTLMATLHTVRAVLKDARMREQANVIQQEVEKMAQDVVRLQNRVGNLKNHFSQADKDIDGIVTSADRIVKRADRIERMEVEDTAEEVEALRPVSTDMRVVERATD